MSQTDMRTDDESSDQIELIGEDDLKEQEAGPTY